MVDGGFYRRRAYARLGDKSPKERADELESYCKRHLNEKIYGIQTSHRLYRIFYYDCLPVSKNIYNPLTKKQVDLSKTDTYKWATEFFDFLKEKTPQSIEITAFLVRLPGLEPGASGLGGSRSIQLSYRRKSCARISNCRENGAIGN